MEAEGLRVIIPAAGKGRRLGSDVTGMPKAMYRACGKPLLETVLEQLDFVRKKDIYIVVGYEKEKIISYFGDGYSYVEQKEQLGTGHAVEVCRPYFEGFDGTVLVTFGDMPLFRRGPMRELCEYRAASGAACVLMTAENPELDMWARIVRDGEGRFRAVVEGRDCTPEQAKIRELFSGVIAFDSRKLFAVLGEVDRDNAQHEYYLTEVPELMARRGWTVETRMTADGDDLRGVNTPEDLRVCEEIMRRRETGVSGQAG